MSSQQRNVRAYGTILVGVALAALVACQDDPTAPAAARTRPADVVAAAEAPIAPVDLTPPGATSGSARDITDAGYIVGCVTGAAGSQCIRWNPSGTRDVIPLASILGVSADGQTVGGTTASGFAAVWNPVGGVIVVPPTSSGSRMQAEGMSRGGTLVGYAQTGNAQYWPINSAVIWMPGPYPPYSLPTPEGPPSGLSWKYVTASGMSGEYIIGTASNVAPPLAQGVRWKLSGGMTTIGPLNASVLAVNSAGTVVGAQNGRAARFDGAGGYTLLPGGFGDSRAVAINGKEEIVVTYGAYDGGRYQSHSYVVRGTSVTPLASLGGCCAIGYAINERTQVVGSATDAAGVWHPVMWDVAAPPLVVQAGGPYTGIEGAPVTFAGSASGGTPPLQFEWSFGDGSTATGANVTHTYANNGTYPVRLTVNGGGSMTVPTTATIANAPPVIGVAPSATIYSGETWTVRARIDDPGVADAPWLWLLIGSDRTVLGQGYLFAVPDSIRVPVTLRRAGTYSLSLGVMDRDMSVTETSVRIDVLRLPVPATVSPPSLHAARRGNGLLTVALFATPAVDPATIAIATIRLGNLTPALRGDGAPMATLEDVNGDGVPELVLKFRRNALADAGLLGGAPLVLRADLTDGRQIEARWSWTR